MYYNRKLTNVCPYENKKSSIGEKIRKLFQLWFTVPWMAAGICRPGGKALREKRWRKCFPISVLTVASLYQYQVFYKLGIVSVFHAPPSPIFSIVLSTESSSLWKSHLPEAIFSGARSPSSFPRLAAGGSGIWEHILVTEPALVGSGFSVLRESWVLCIYEEGQIPKQRSWNGNVADFLLQLCH